MKEVEVLVRLDVALREAKQKLKKFNYQGDKRTLDVYFCDPKRKNLKPNKDYSLDEVLRLRTKNDNCYIAYKINHYDKNGIWIYSDEHETEVIDFDAMLKILNHLGLEPLVEVDITKYTYLTEDYEIVLEDVKELGEFLEVERLKVADDEEIEKVKNEIREFIKGLGFKYREMTYGKPELLLKKKNNIKL